MRITLAFNLRQGDGEEHAEHIEHSDVKRLLKGLRHLGHQATPVEVTCPGDQMVDRLLRSRPDLVFNVAEGVSGAGREAFYPAVYELLHLPYTGGGPGLLYVDLDKRLTEKLLSVHGVKVPRGVLLTSGCKDLPDDLPLPLFVKPNYEGSSKGIGLDALAISLDEARERAGALLSRYPEGVAVEQFIPGRELTVPCLEAWPGRSLEVVEHVLGTNGSFFHYELKHNGYRVPVRCPAPLSPKERQDVLVMAERVLRFMPMPDLGRVDIRLHEDGTPYFIEVNPLPSLRPKASLMVAAKSKGLDYHDVLGLIIRSAAQRYGLSLALRPRRPGRPRVDVERPTPRRLGLTIGRFRAGTYNAITDVRHVKVGHVTRVRNLAPRNGGRAGTGHVRTGVTAIVPETPNLFSNHLVAGGFVLNGIGEVSGLIQAMEWGWLETPILLTNTMSVGAIHQGIIRYMVDRYPDLGRKVDVIIPIIGETNDAFLNDVRLAPNTARHAIRAIEDARSGPVPQGSVGCGTGMISFDFAGGVGTSSRVLEKEQGGYTVGVLVQSNFGRMKNLTVEGAVVGRAIDRLYPMTGRRRRMSGSIIVVVATDAPMLSSQLSQLAKRAALGLGRVGSHAASTSGEIVFAFSTGNRTSREAKEQVRHLNLTFVSGDLVDTLYEAVVEATEEAVLNSMFCSPGMDGRLGRYAPPLPHDMVLEQLAKGRRVEAPPEELSTTVATRCLDRGS